MVRINGAFDFNVYSFDTINSVVERLSALMNTLPEYLYIPVEENSRLFLERLRTKDTAVVRDLLKQMKTQQLSELSSLVDILKGPNAPNFLVKKKLDIILDVISPSIAYSKDLSVLPEDEIAPLLLRVKHSLDDSVGNVLIEQMWERKKSIKEDITRGIARNKALVEESGELIREKPLNHTKFKQDDIALRYVFNMKDLTLLEIFDKIVLTPRIPFTSSNDLYKILRDFTPDPDWISTHEGAIYFKIRKTLPSLPPEYINAVLTVEGEPGEEKGILTTDLFELKKGASEETVIRDLREIFHPRIALREKGVIIEEKGVFQYYLGESPITEWVFSDLIMNDPLFNQYLAIDEFNTVNRQLKRKGSTIFIHFFGTTPDQNVKANLTIYQVRDDDTHGQWKIGSYYLKVKVVRVENNDSLKRFTLVFGKLLSLYYKKAPGIIKVYRDLLGDEFPPKYQALMERPTGKKTRIPLSKIAPDVFVSGYPTDCQHPPLIITSEEAKIAREKGQNVMLYPKTPDEGFPQRYYVCDPLSAYPYPGLQSNRLSNNNIVPFLPCCFKSQQDFGFKGQEGRDTKTYGHYFYGRPMLDRSGTAQPQLLVRDVFTNPPETAKLPPELDEMLNLVVYRQNWSFIRGGVFDSRSSFIECVLEALQTHDDRYVEKLMYKKPETVKALDNLAKAENKKSRKQASAKLWKAKRKERINLLKEIRKELATPINAAGCSQEMYDYSSDEIQEHIRDPQRYFDPRYFTNLVERYFKCRIILFSRVIHDSLQDSKYQGGFNTTLSLPRHIQSYYRTATKVPTILIYERVGRSREQKDYPRCELISYWNTESNSEIKRIYKYHSIVANQMQLLYERVRNSYSLNCPVLETILPLNRLTNIGITFTHQEIDSYGKCRALIFNYRGKRGTFLTTPIQPLLLPRAENEVTPRLTQELAKSIFRSLAIKIDKVSITPIHVSAFSGIIGNVRFSLPFEKGHIILPGQGVPTDTEQDLVARDQSTSQLSSYIRDKRIARYMVEYARWLYSRFLHSESGHDSIENLRRFVSENLVIDEGFEYGPIAKIFSTDSGLTKNSKLYVKSSETKKRLIYTLQLYTLQHPNLLKEYYLRQSISNYYLNVSDFTRYRCQVILQSDDAVQKWIRERNQDYSLHSDVVTGGTAPYFFKNSQVGEEMYLVQPASGLSEALDIDTIWGDSQTNKIVSEEAITPHVKDFMIYSYKSPTNIEPYVCNGGCRAGEDDGLKILGYRDEDNNPTYMSLLPLELCKD
jgi:predicted outer membrane protein